MAIASLIVAGLVAGCNFQRDSGSEPPGEGAVQTAPTSAQQEPGTVIAGGASPLPPGVTPSVEPTSTDPLQAEIDRMLDELDSLNATADPLEDQP